MEKLLFQIQDRAKGLLVLLQKILPSIISLSLFILPRVVLAFSGDTPVGEGLGYVIDAMYGTTGIAIATLAIIAVGLLCLGHYLEWKRLLQTVTGVGIIFGAGAIVRGIQSLVHN